MKAKNSFFTDTGKIRSKYCKFFRFAVLSSHVQLVRLNISSPSVSASPLVIHMRNPRLSAQTVFIPVEDENSVGAAISDRKRRHARYVRLVNLLRTAIQ